MLSAHSVELTNLPPDADLHQLVNPKPQNGDQNLHVQKKDEEEKKNLSSATAGWARLPPEMLVP